jgi:hypothetical protein
MELKAVLENVWDIDRAVNQKTSLWTHEHKLCESRTKFYASKIMESLNKLPKPNSPDGLFFDTPLNSYVAIAFEPSEMAQLLDALPFKSAEFSIKKGNSEMRVIVPRDEVLQLRKEATKKPKNPEKPSLLATLEANEQRSKEQFGQIEQGKNAPKKSKGAEIQ